MKDTVQIVTISQMKLVGCQINTSMNKQKNKLLWQEFMPHLKEIKSRCNENLYSVQVYNELLEFKDFSPDTIFENWAAVEVHDFFKIPHGMEKLTIPKGKYAVFTYHGMAINALKAIRYIFEEWIPDSDFQVDQRPHFQIMEPGYKPNDPKAKETFWVPIK